MFKLKIDTESKIAVYKQLMSEINSAILDGRLKSGDIVPSMNELADELGISKETVKRAYGLLREKGVLEAHQGKGFYIADENKKESISILFLFDKFSTYKQEVVNGFHREVKDKTDETILLFNQDLDLFEYFLNENLGRFDYYIVTPHFPLDAASQKRAAKMLRRIPNHKLIMLDNWVTEVPGNYGAVYQDFTNDVRKGLQEGCDKLKALGNLNVITLPSSLYGSRMSRTIRAFCKENGISVKFLSGAPSRISKGDVFLMLNSQLDSGLIALWEKGNAAGLKPGEDYHLISYNETQIDAIVLNGLTTISTDFLEMGREAARMINERRMWKKHCEFGMNRRNTF